MDLESIAPAHSSISSHLNFFKSLSRRNLPLFSSFITQTFDKLWDILATLATCQGIALILNFCFKLTESLAHNEPSRCLFLSGRTVPNCFHRTPRDKRKPGVFCCFSPEELLKLLLSNLSSKLTFTGLFFHSFSMVYQVYVSIFFYQFSFAYFYYSLCLSEDLYCEAGIEVMEVTSSFNTGFSKLRQWFTKVLYINMVTCCTPILLRSRITSEEV